MLHGKCEAHMRGGGSHCTQGYKHITGLQATCYSMLSVQLWRELAACLCKTSPTVGMDDVLGCHMVQRTIGCKVLYCNLTARKGDPSRPDSRQWPTRNSPTAPVTPQHLQCTMYNVQYGTVTKT